MGFFGHLLVQLEQLADLIAHRFGVVPELRRLIAEIGEFDAAAVARLASLEEIAFPAAFTFAVNEWNIPVADALAAYLWSWLENQVMAALKAVPLGQTDGQRLLAKLGARIPAVCDEAVTMADEDLSNFMPGLAILSSVHETQYSRLFRS